MSFFGSAFIFDDVPSEIYNLYISSPDGGMVETSGSGDVEILTQKVFRNPKPYLLGVQQSPVLSFEVQFTSPNELMSDDIRIIQAWLCGRQTYKKLQIIQADMQDIYYNCFITNPKIIRAGNMIRGISATVICDSPFAWGFPQVFTLDYPNGTANVNVSINNISDNTYYEYPSVFIIMDNLGGTVRLTNNSDNGRQFQFIELSALEELTIDNEKCIITSSTGLRRLSKFNKNWFRLVNGENNINAFGNFEHLEITYNPARKVA